MSTRADRYVHAVLRGIPESQRADIDAELRGLIADAVEARRAAGADPEAAENEALLELGDPRRLAASYSERPLALVGPTLYPDYVRLLKLLLAIVLPVAAFGYTIAQVIAGVAVGELVVSLLALLLSVAVHLAFWTTLVFAVLERTGSWVKPLVRWSPDSLPELPTPGRPSLVDVVCVAVLLAIWVGALVWQQLFSVFHDEDGSPIPVLDPELWRFWIPYLIVLAAVEIVFVVVLYRVGRWTPAFAGINILLNAAVAGPVIGLLVSGRAFNSAFFAEFGQAELVEPGHPVVAVAVAAVAGVAIWDCIDGILKTVRARRASA